MRLHLAAMPPLPPRRIWTIGHSNRELDAFIAMLTGADISQVVDVRRFPGSRRQPHFGKAALGQALVERGVEYVHLPALGGRRGKPAPDSPNRGWRVASFAAYADYMATEEFAQGLQRLEVLGATTPTAIMCSEAVPWRCHRRLIADALLIRGWLILDILGPRKITPHELTPFAQACDGTLSYPGP